MTDKPVRELTPEEKILEKHKPLSTQAILKNLKESESAKNKYTKDLGEVEKNFTSFIEREEPIINPYTDQPMAWMREIPYAEFIGIIPNSLKGTETPEQIKLAMNNISEDDKDYVFVMMEKMITTPKHNVNEWKQLANQTFIKVFELKVGEYITRIYGDAAFL